MTTTNDALREALDLIDEIVLAGMSGSGQESEEGMRDFHAQQAWNFISIAARAKEKLRNALAQQAAGTKLFTHPHQQAERVPLTTLQMRQLFEIKNSKYAGRRICWESFLDGLEAAEEVHGINAPKEPGA